jgi:radical SAM superfamily enzyme YgiQ (UPF0313 family)
VQCLDEGIADIPLDLDVDLVGITVITGTARRAYELADHYRTRGITVVLGGPHVTLIPEDAQPHADAIVVGYAEDTWPELLRDCGRGAEATLHDGPGLSPGRPSRAATFPSRVASLPTASEATRGCAPARVLRRAYCVGRKPFQKPVADVEDIRRHAAKQLIFVDQLIADRAYARVSPRSSASRGMD